MNHIVLVHPAIPQNTGNIMRTCVATNTSLHIIKPMSFELDDKKVKRAGLDYIKDLDLHVYESYEEFKAKNPGEYHFFTRYSKLCYTDQDYSDSSKEHYLFFGHEHDGIPKEILKENHINARPIEFWEGKDYYKVAYTTYAGNFYIKEFGK